MAGQVASAPRLLRRQQAAVKSWNLAEPDAMVLAVDPTDWLRKVALGHICVAADGFGWFARAGSATIMCQDSANAARGPRVGGEGKACATLEQKTALAQLGQVGLRATVPEVWC